MDAHVPSALAVLHVPGVVGEPFRRSANFHPSIWGDRFLGYPSDSPETDDVEATKKFQQLKEEVRGLISAVLVIPKNHYEPLSEIQVLTMIDDIQRLGVSYHFEELINQALEHIYHTGNQDESSAYPVCNRDLHTVSLRFRLLRQHGYNISCDVFRRFMNEGSVLKESHAENVQALLSFYEATQLYIHGEDMLVHAHTFSVSRLQHSIPHLSPQTAAQVRYALKWPIHKGLPRLEARHYIDIYESQQDDKLHHKSLLMFAKLDFNFLQKLHKEELTSITRWWKELDFTQELPFARDRVVECYFWSLSVFFAPEYGLARKRLTKVIKMISIMDDIYDVHGTFEELELLTNAIERWDIKAANQLPKYMKIFYETLLDVYDEIEEQMTMKDTLYMFSYTREAMKTQARVYMEEARWFQVNKLPTMEEYMNVALVSSSCLLIAITALLGMGNIATQSTFEWISRTPKIVKATLIIGRLMNDIVSHEFEQKRGHVASAVECYMHQYGVSEAVAREELHKQVTDAWKDINEECMKPISVPKPVLMLLVNHARVNNFAYKDVDGYTNPATALEQPIVSLLIDPVPI